MSGYQYHAPKPQGITQAELDRKRAELHKEPTPAQREALLVQRIKSAQETTDAQPKKVKSKWAKPGRQDPKPECQPCIKEAHMGGYRPAPRPIVGRAMCRKHYQRWYRRNGPVRN